MDALTTQADDRAVATGREPSTGRPECAACLGRGEASHGGHGEAGTPTARRMRDCRGGARVRGGRYGASSWTLLILTTKTRTQSGCIPPGLVSRLLERGHAEAVERWAGRGEWFCAREWARLLAERGRQAEALEVLAPYVATGWWTAAAAMAELLEANGRADEAISLVRPHAEGGDRLALGFFARLLARHGRGVALPDAHQVVEGNVVFAPRGRLAGGERIVITSHDAAVLNSQKVKQGRGERHTERTLGFSHHLVRQRLLDAVVTVTPERRHDLIESSHGTQPTAQPQDHSWSGKGQAVLPKSCPRTPTPWLPGRG